LNESNGSCEKHHVFFQPKLAINQPNDIYEQEADAMAERVVNKPASENNDAFFKPSVADIQRKCADCEEEEKSMQHKEKSSDAMNAPVAAEKYINTLSGGNAMNEKDKSFFESRMGYDFSQVKIHTDTKAARSAQSVNALAYTSGNNIVFNNGPI
jgi:hypothetical protein